MREANNKTQLASLLAPFGLSVDEAQLLPSRVDASRDLHVRWNAPDKAGERNAFTDTEPETRLLSLVTSRRRGEGLARQRSLELSTTQVLIVAVNAQRQARWWSLMPDPRLLRAETADQEGRLSGQTLYRKEADFAFALPDDSSITEVRLYHPQWNGAEFSLEAVGEIRLY